jgi:hypothetical protein
VGLIRIRPPAIAPFVSDIVQLDGRNGTGIGAQDEKIQRELADSIEDSVGPSSAFEIQDLQELHLRQNDLVGQTLDQALVQGALVLTEQVSFGFHWPRP